MKLPVIMLIDDEESIITSLRGSLEDDGHVVLSASDGAQALEILNTQPVDIVFLDIWLPGMDGIETLKAIKDLNARIEVVMMTGHGTVNTAVQAVKHGAFDFLEKPFSLDQVTDIIRKIQDARQTAPVGAPASEQSRQAEDMLCLTGQSPEIEAIKQRIPALAADTVPLFVQGEIGSGKETFARLVHQASPMRALALKKYHCVYCDPDQLAREVLGSADAPGLLSVGSNVVFLHSVDALPLALQDAIAAALVEQSEAGCRVIATTVKDVAAAIKRKLLSKRLYACFPQTVVMPALRHRRADIRQLVLNFLDFFAAHYNVGTRKIDADALEILVNYDWPGNVKELKNLVEKLVVTVPTEHISTHDLPLSLREEMHGGMIRSYDRFASLQDAEEAWRKSYLLYHLRKNDRDFVRTAKALGVREKRLREMTRACGIVLSDAEGTAARCQRTLKRSMVLSGRGLHSGDKTGLIISPLPGNSGIHFGNISSGGSVPASIEYVVSTDYATSLRHDSATARTIEHLLATLHAYRITNAMIKVNNEVPIMDGSALDFCQLIEDAGIEEQAEELEEVVVTEPFTIGTVSESTKFITVEPADTFSIHYSLRYPEPVGFQEYTFVLDDPNAFKTQIAPARTFGFLRDIEALNEKGLASGGRLNNFILIDDEKIVNTDLRFPDEFVRHKILDMLGDLYLLGRPVRAAITANMTGHTENAELVRALQQRMNFTG